MYVCIYAHVCWCSGVGVGGRTRKGQYEVSTQASTMQSMRSTSKFTTSLQGWSADTSTVQEHGAGDVRVLHIEIHIHVHVTHFCKGIAVKGLHNSFYGQLNPFLLTWLQNGAMCIKRLLHADHQITKL